MNSDETHIKFEEACNKMSSLEGTLAPDVMLRLYAYYKQVVKSDGFYRHTSQNVIDSFKINACMQIRGMSEKEARQAYIDLANEIVNKNIKY